MTCWQWARFLGETDVCDTRDKAGFVIGLVSIACWGLAEVPQLVANAAEGSSEGISEGLLWLWVFSDVLDVAGCTIADTLPTMVITAWMYFIFTMLLLLQHIYYKRNRLPTLAGSKSKPGDDCEAAAPLLSSSSCGDEPDLVAELFGAHLQLPVTHTGSSHTMYGSLRNLSIRRTSSSSSLSLSDTGRRLHDSFTDHHQRHQRRRRIASRDRLAACSSPDRPSTADAAAGSSTAWLPGALPASFSSAAAASRMLGGLALVGLVACSGGRLMGSNAAGRIDAGRQLLERGQAAGEQQLWGISYATWGAAMGWAMAVTFFLGRVPQVIKNWQRQSCAGLSMEMFVIVLTAAATYCASILIRARSWADLLPKLPFLTDAAVGALLDLVILCQFSIYRGADEPADAAGSSSSGSSDAAALQVESS